MSRTQFCSLCLQTMLRNVSTLTTLSVWPHSYSAWDTYKASHGSPTAVNVTLFLPRNASSEPAGDGGSSGGGLSQMGQVLVGAIIGGVAAAGGPRATSEPFPRGGHILSHCSCLAQWLVGATQ